MLTEPHTIIGHLGHDSTYSSLKQTIRVAKDLGAKDGFYRGQVLRIMNERNIIVVLVLNGTVYYPSFVDWCCECGDEFYNRRGDDGLEQEVYCLNCRRAINNAL